MKYGLCLSLTSALCLWSASSASAFSLEKVDFFSYHGDAPFISQIHDALCKRAHIHDVKIHHHDGRGDVSLQLEQIDDILNQDPQVLAVNLVDPATAEFVVEQARQKQKSVIFFNREPYSEILSSYNNAYYVGADAEFSGMLQGKVLADFLKHHPGIDHNHDGVINLIIISGPAAHQDSMPRSSSFMAALSDEGIKYSLMHTRNGDWSFQSGATVMQQLIEREDFSLDDVEAVAANNDAMALGALSVLQQHGFNQTPGDDKYIAVVGIDGLPDALSAIDQGVMAGTVLNDYEMYADIIFDLSVKIAEGEAINQSCGIPLIDGNYFDIPYEVVFNRHHARARSLVD